MVRSGKSIRRNKITVIGAFICAVVFLLCSVFLACEVGVIKNAEATATSNALGEIWDSTNNKFNQKAVEKLYEKLGGSNVTGTGFQAKFTALNTWAGTARTSADFRANNGNSNVVVTLGGRTWVATYLTQANGNLVLTLLLTDTASVTEKFNNTSAKSNTVAKYPSDSYGSSYVRASLISGDSTKLNSADDANPVASYLATAGSSALTALTASTTLGNEFATYTASALSNYILAPSQVGYQEHLEIGSGYSAFPYSTSNDAYGSVPNTNFCGANSAYNYYTNTVAQTSTYTRWKDDKIWMPSLAEIGLSSTKSGLWATDTDIRTTGTYYMTRSSGYSSYYGYYYFDPGDGGVTHDQKFAEADTVSRIRPAIHLNLSATAATASSGIAKPTRDTTTFTYNGNQQTYRPANFDSETMDITGNEQTVVKIKSGSTTHEADPNGYKVEVTPKMGYNWYGGSTDPVEFDFVIKKANPTVTPQYTLSNPMYESLGLPTITTKAGDTAGTISWDNGQNIEADVSKNYNWTFIPTDEDNYNRKTGSEPITFVSARATGVKVVVKSGVNIYDRYDTDLYTSFEDYIKDCISVYTTYQDGSQSTSPIPNSDYTVQTTQQQIMVTAGSTTENKDITVKANSGGYRDTVNTAVHESKITSVYISQKNPLPKQLVYPVTLDDIKNNYAVELTWNFAPSKGIVAPDSKITVAVKPNTTDNPSGVIKAGNIDLTITYTDGTLVRSEDLLGNCNIDKGDYDLSGITFADSSVAYDGTKKTAAITGDIKDKKTGNVIASGVTVSYAYKKGGSQVSTDGVIDVGTYDVVASFANSNANYNDFTSTDIKTAKLTVTNKSWNMTGVTFTDDTLTYDGTFHNVAIGGVPLPDNRIQVTYKYEKGGVEVSAPNGVKDAGVYTVTASFSNPDPTNYADIPDMTATLTINKANFDMSGITFADKTVTANGTSSFTIEITGNLPNPGIVVTYTVDGYAETSFGAEGIYAFTASFSNPDPANYNNIADMTATLTINANPNPTPEPPPNNGTNLWDKIVQTVENGFPLWQIATIAVGGLLSIVFLIKSIQYGNRRKKAKGEAKKISAKTYAALLPVFATDIVLAGLSNKIWSIIAFAMVGVTVLMFLIAIITRKGWKKAELAKEQAIEDSEQRKIEAQEAKQRAREEAQEARQLALQDRLTQMSAGGAAAMDSSVFEQRLLEMEERHRQEMARRDEEIRRENERREEEQAKRDEALKIMLANMMGRQQGMDGDIQYSSVDDTDLLVQKVIAGLLPVVQQMAPAPTAYLSAPDSVDNESINALTSALQQQNEQIIRLQNQIADMSHNVLDAEVIPDNSEEIQALKEEHSAELKAMSDKMNDKMQAMSDEHFAEMQAMRSQLEALSSMSVDELDDEDFDDEEEWDSILDEDDDDFVEAVIIDDNGKERKVYPNFRMRLKQSSDKNREWYAVIKNLFCSQKGVTYRVYKRVEKIRYQGQVIAVIGIAKRSIKLWLALKPYEYDARRYHHKDVSDKPRFVDVPMYVRVGSDRALDRSQELILALFQELNMEARKRYTDRPIQELIFTLKHNRLLTNKQNKQLLCEVMHVHDCDVIDDETAEKCIEAKNVEFIDDSNIETVKLDDIDAKFQDGNRVTLDRLKKVGLVSEDCTGYTVTADKRLTKPLIIVANDFTLTAVKLIALTGGRAIRLQTV